ncbi:MAG: lactate racemase domain-containing protein [Acidobacteria bacterium]|nr:lactate racemase domain-containing protein [Acidobacteriota bacterium]
MPTRRQLLAAAASTVPALKGSSKALLLPTHEHFGDIQERIDLPAAWEVQLVKMAGHAAPALTRDQIRTRLQTPIGGHPLREIAAGKKTAIITFDDLSRATPTFEVAPLILEELHAAGLAEENIIFLGAVGAHRTLEQPDAVRKLGRQLASRYVWLNHNAFDSCQDIGQTSFGNRVKINRNFLAADVRITISGIKLHNIAGYGGGAKSVLPGVAGFDCIKYNHKTIADNNRTAVEARIFHNDVRQDMEQAARLARVDFSVQLVLNGYRKVAGVFAGDVIEAHRAACRLANRNYRTPVVHNADVVIANGFPQNSQATKGVTWIRESVREGGTGVLVLQHPEGLHAWHYLLQPGYPAGRTYWDTIGGKPTPQRFQLIVYSQYLSRKSQHEFPPGTLFAPTWEEAARHLLARHKTDARVAVYPATGLQHHEIDLDG